ncbi:hypothetical protein H9P43_004199 [Blastocladiella emersonii ATCC 22665]|nr:hypothetical protein H9P43_004199 [Blastocladiella emersonii ATCC 22665]
MASQLAALMASNPQLAVPLLQALLANQAAPSAAAPNPLAGLLATALAQQAAPAAAAAPTPALTPAPTAATTPAPPAPTAPMAQLPVPASPRPAQQQPASPARMPRPLLSPVAPPAAAAPRALTQSSPVRKSSPVSVPDSRDDSPMAEDLPTPAPAPAPAPASVPASKPSKDDYHLANLLQTLSAIQQNAAASSSPPAARAATTSPDSRLARCGSSSAPGSQRDAVPLPLAAPSPALPAAAAAVPAKSSTVHRGRDAKPARSAADPYPSAKPKPAPATASKAAALSSPLPVSAPAPSAPIDAPEPVPVPATTPSGIRVTVSHQAKHIYVSDLPGDIDEFVLRRTFRKFGKIDDVRLPRDKLTSNIMGFVYIKFNAHESALRACDESGKLLLNGQAVTIAMSREDVSEKAVRTLFLANMWEVPESDVLSLFGAYGTIASCDILEDRGMVYIHYQNVSDAVRAHTELQGLMLNDRYVRIEFSQSAEPRTNTSSSSSAKNPRVQTYYARGGSRGARGGAEVVTIENTESGTHVQYGPKSRAAAGNIPLAPAPQQAPAAARGHSVPPRPVAVAAPAPAYPAYPGYGGPPPGMPYGAPAYYPPPPLPHPGYGYPTGMEYAADQGYGYGYGYGPYGGYPQYPVPLQHQPERRRGARGGRGRGRKPAAQDEEFEDEDDEVVAETATGVHHRGNRPLEHPAAYYDGYDDGYGGM